MSSIYIPCGYLKFNLSIIPSIQSKSQVFAPQLLQSHIYIKAAIPFTLCAFSYKRTFQKGQYFILVPHNSLPQIIIPETNQTDVCVYEQCVIDSSYTFLTYQPFIQLGESGLYFYHGSLVDSPLYWVDQIQYPIHNLSFCIKEDPICVTRFTHSHGYILQQDNELNALVLSIDVYSAYSEDPPQICIYYLKKRRHQIHSLCITKYGIPFEQYTYDIVQNWMSFDAALRRVHSYMKSLHQLSTYAQFIKIGQSYFSEEIYHQFLNARGI